MCRKIIEYFVNYLLADLQHKLLFCWVIFFITIQITREHVKIIFYFCTIERVVNKSSTHQIYIVLDINTLPEHVENARRYV